MGLFRSNIYIMSIISHGQYNFESLKQYYFGKPYVGVSKVTPKTVVTLDKFLQKIFQNVMFS